MNTTIARMRTVTTATLAGFVLVAALALTGCSTSAASAAHADTGAGAAAPMHMANGSSIDKQIELYTTMSNLWAQHMEWTYATVVAFAQGSPGLTATLDRLLQNQTDIGNAVGSFYGTAAGDQLTALLKTHIEDAVPVLTAAKAGDTAALNTAVAAWYANAKQIGDFLAAANPHWGKADMEDMMQTHITQTLAYASDLLHGDYAKAIVDYGTAETHMQQMATMLSAGLIKQFPKKFD
ncbi:hypothetical protein [Microbacterium capsulatum]|uniref:Lipoprotein n=1 Tax=Microbacterium capsulatum TaxID=3041921 RepID=A0ABU0XKF4_9MICO|nr:hypothetical protein [Microbacterium sp. ASV81]MDQ4215073.1 hypothetical protein [Microbacterium sp. ASV81]